MDEEQVKKPRKQDKRSREKQTFDGFTQEDIDRYFCMPNMAIDIIADIDSLAELKVVLYIMRHTWGFHEYEGDKRIKVDEFMYGRKSNGKRMDSGTKLSEMSVRNGLDLAEKHGYIISHVDDKDKAKIKKSYELHTKSGVKILDPTRKKGVKILDLGVQNLYPTPASRGKDFRPGSEKDTGEINQRIDTSGAPTINQLKSKGIPKDVEQMIKTICNKYDKANGRTNMGKLLDIYQENNIEDPAQFKQLMQDVRTNSKTIEQFFDNLKLALNRFDVEKESVNDATN